MQELPKVSATFDLKIEFIRIEYISFITDGKKKKNI